MDTLNWVPTQKGLNKILSAEMKPLRSLKGFSMLDKRKDGGECRNEE